MTVPLHQLLDHPTLTIVLHKRLEYISGHIDFLRLNDVRITHYIPITFDKDDKSLNHQIALAKMLGPHVESRRSGFPAAIFQWQGKDDISGWEVSVPHSIHGVHRGHFLGKRFTLSFYPKGQLKIHGFV